MWGSILAAGMALVLIAGAEARTMRMVVADLPYVRVWDGAVRALAAYPIERAADGVVATGWRERDPRADETGWSRVRERVTLRVEPMGERITRVTVEVEAQGRRNGDWVALEDTEGLARDVLARLRDVH